MDSTTDHCFDSFKTIKVDTHDNRYHIYADNLIFCLTNSKGMVKPKAIGSFCTTCNKRFKDLTTICDCCNVEEETLSVSLNIIEHSINNICNLKITNNKLFFEKDGILYTQSTHNGAKCFRKLCSLCKTKPVKCNIKNHCKNCIEAEEKEKKRRAAREAKREAMKEAKKEAKRQYNRLERTRYVKNALENRKDTNKKIQKDRRNKTIAKKRMSSEDIKVVQPITLSRREFQYDDDEDKNELPSPLCELSILPIPSITPSPRRTHHDISVDDLCSDFMNVHT